MGRFRSCLFLLSLLTARTTTILCLSDQLIDDLLANFKYWKATILLISMVHQNWHVKLGYLLPKVLSLEVRLEPILSNLN